ncbi:MAG TPA: xanthine dehydrogenase family protein molybdopterin-binding subunit [Xanthobacteraceae bacterium]|jgi:isoquinoline 1-oxidoreductase beta subunit|nr:xanthine dehydrogenase family protein molybdopterin-binding subunit [Xanthobacteraceae bacterium]
MGPQRQFNREAEVAVPNPAGVVSRRAFMEVGLGGLVIGFDLFGAVDARAQSAHVFAPNAYIRMGRDGRVTLFMQQIEMGEGTYTAQAMLIAEELEVDLAQVGLEAAPPDDRLYANKLLGFQVTGGSSSIRATWEPLRRAGATARVMLVTAAARGWNVDPASCRAERGAVIHGETGRTQPYGALVDVAATLPVPTDVPLKDPKQFKLIGTPAKRLDTPDKVNGRAVFGIDVRLPGMKIAAVEACPVIGGRLIRADDSRASKIAGVRQVVRLDDAVAVIADHMWAAKLGLAALDVDWDEGPNAKLSSADIVRQMDAASQKAGVVARQEGDVKKAMANAAITYAAIYELPFLAHATMEPMNCTVHVRPDGCDVWVGTQVITRAQATAAAVTGLPPEKVQVHNHYLGGGFGRRLEVDFVTQAVRIGQQVDGPVKVVWTREDDIRHDIYRPYYFDRIAAGLDDQGRPVAWNHRVTGSSIMARWIPAAFKNGLDTDAVEGAAENLLYTFPNMLVDYVRSEPPGLLTGWWRGVGSTHNIFVVESFIDELAAAALKDPVEYRLDLLRHSPRATAVLELATQNADWKRVRPKRQGRGVSVQYAFGSYLSQVADISVADNGEVRVNRVVCAVDCGAVVNPDTIKAQIEGGIIFGLTAALFGQITLRNGRVEQGNFNDYRALRMNEAPAIDVTIVNSAEAPGGIGEPGTVGIAPALANAIYDATSIRIRKLPLNRDSLRSA